MPLLMSYTGLSVASEAVPKTSAPQPVAVFMETRPTPWTDTPRVVVYSDGSVLYADGISERRYWGIRYDYRSTKVIPVEYRRMLLNWQPIWDVPNHGFANLSDIDHIATAVFVVVQGTKTKTYAVRGLDCEISPEQAPHANIYSQLPSGVLELHQSLCNMSFAGAQKWTPDKIEVQLRQHLGPTTDAFLWPKTWPSLSSRMAKRVFRGYSITLDGEVLTELKNLIGDKHSPQHVRLAARDWTINYREVFPGEPIWRKAISGKL
ncbi:MAG: hypothetical protein ABL973_02685 [Micropepsaceae bacterium]